MEQASAFNPRNQDIKAHRTIALRAGIGIIVALLALIVVSVTARWMWSASSPMATIPFNGSLTLLSPLPFERSGSASLAGILLYKPAEPTQAIVPAPFPDTVISSAAVSPTRDKIAYVASKDFHAPQLFMYSLSHGTSTLIAGGDNSAYEFPVWSGDEHSLAYLIGTNVGSSSSSSLSEKHITVTNIITHASSDAVFGIPLALSYDGTQLVYADNEALHLLKIGGSDSVVAQLPAISLLSSALSPDRNWLAIIAQGTTMLVHISWSRNSAAVTNTFTNGYQSGAFDGDGNLLLVKGTVADVYTLASTSPTKLRTYLVPALPLTSSILDWSGLANP